MIRILIVDDDPQYRKALKRFLSDQNVAWHFLLASGKTDALEKIRTQHRKQEEVAVLLTDLVMEEEDSGICLIEEAHELDPNLMAILFTIQEEPARYDAFRRGAFEVVERNSLGDHAGQEILVKLELALRHRQRMIQNNTLRRYFDPQVLDTIIGNPDMLKLQKREVTIVFWDIQGFSALSDQLEAHPDLIAVFLRRHCDAIAKFIFEHGGVLDKFIGDGVMAIFGVFEEGLTDAGAKAAVRAALSVRGSFDEILGTEVSRWKAATAVKLVQIGLRCGINTGDALVGNAGTEFRDQFTALGNSVNLASRIETEADGFKREILITETTRSRLPKAVDTKLAKVVSNIKNIPGTYELFSVEAWEDEPNAKL